MRYADLLKFPDALTSFVAAAQKDGLDGGTTIKIAQLLRDGADLTTEKAREYAGFQGKEVLVQFGFEYDAHDGKDPNRICLVTLEDSDNLVLGYYLVDERGLEFPLSKREQL